MERSSKCDIYKHLIHVRSIQPYLCKPISSAHKRIITKFRLSSHKLYIETGRYVGLNRTERLCQNCDTHNIEDEFHFMLQCPLYSNLRTQYIKPYYFRRPSAFKLIELLSTHNVKELCNLARYIKLAFDVRGDP